MEAGTERNVGRRAIVWERMAGQIRVMLGVKWPSVSVSGTEYTMATDLTVRETKKTALSANLPSQDSNFGWRGGLKSAFEAFRQRSRERGAFE
jgi:hypothetical protein